MAGLLVGPAPAAAHVVVGARTLRGLTADAVWALRAEVVSPARRPAAPGGGPFPRPVAEARVLEVLKGPSGAAPSLAPGATVRVAQHGHGKAEHAAGDAMLLFLQPLGAVA
ncbi:MAG: hypothetical protein R3263_11695, partial [Myxococcota bacterium]|nr:hypothetical protein [Myxococcota bacterium]